MVRDEERMEGTHADGPRLEPQRKRGVWWQQEERVCETMTFCKEPLNQTRSRRQTGRGHGQTNRMLA